MKNKDIIVKVSKKIRRAQDHTAEMLNLFIDEIRENIENGNDVEFLDFGTIENYLQNQKIIYNPQTNKKTLHPPKNKVKLVSSEQIKKTLNSKIG